jgi:putative transposase
MRVWGLVHEGRLPRKNWFKRWGVKNNFVGAANDNSPDKKNQALYWLKAGSTSPSLTDVAERLGIHRITVHRWLKQYSVGGLRSLLKIGKLTGRSRVIPQAIIAGLSNKLSEESCEFKSYKEIGKWVEDKYQTSIKYPTLHKQVHYRMKAKLKVPRRSSIKKDNAAGIEF